MANHFDRILKENIKVLFPFFAQREGIEIGETEELKDKLQITLEREADFLQRILHDNSNNDYILHFEFQVTDEIVMMIRRFLVYRSILLYKTGLRVKQFVIYLGQTASKMVSHIEQEDLLFRIGIINLCQIPYQDFLNSNKPEAIIMAILADFKEESSEKIIEKVLAKLVETVQSRLLLSKYVVQLQVLSNLRNLQPEVFEIVKKIPMIFDIDLSKDPMFKEAIDKGHEIGLEKGLKKGLEKGLDQSIIRLLQSKILTHQQIADVLNVPLARVEKLQKELDAPPQNGKKKK
ncbi:MAG: hypothetical protein JNL70_08565 [Saprospiraceae bacterium]|nr:hypothetical protein [Saprospiraceae bacterium]